MYVEAAEVEDRDGAYVHDGKPVTRSLGKMGKSLKNAVSPDEVSEQYGCDTMRLYEMYMGPLDASKPWEPRDIIGMHRFLHRVWRNLVGEDGARRRGARPGAGAGRIGDGAPSPEEHRLVHGHQGRDREHGALQVQHGHRRPHRPERRDAALARDSEGERRGIRADAGAARPPPRRGAVVEARTCRSLAHEGWPEWDDHPLADAQVEIPVQVMGRVRSHLMVAADADAPALERAALADPKVQGHVAARPSGASSSCRASS